MSSPLCACFEDVPFFFTLFALELHLGPATYFEIFGNIAQPRLDIQVFFYPWAENVRFVKVLKSERNQLIVIIDLKGTFTFGHNIRQIYRNFQYS